jgi:uncharacterized metal-binding protein YceD (DUF177 family)
MTAGDLPPPEFSRLVDIRQSDGATLRLEPNANERAALARRFEIVRIDTLVAEMELTREGVTVRAEGRLTAAIVQSCAVSGDDLAVAIDEPLQFRFVPARTDHRPEEEIELEAEDCDEIEFSGTAFDLGEAVAQSLGLAIDPFAVGPGAEEARRAAGIVGEGATGPFAALGALKKQG